MGYLDGDSLLIRIRAAFGATVTDDPDTWAWTDITSYWHAPDDIEITWGRSQGAEQAETHRLGLTLKNSDGRFSAFYPLSPHYPHVVQWTPITVDIDLGDGDGWRNRYSGFVRSWPTEWPGRSGQMALAKIKAVGVLGRLGRGKPPEPSPFRRSISASSPVAYWPGEDGVASGQIASAISGHQAMTVIGTVRFVETADLNFAGANPDVVLGSASLVDLAAGASLSVTVPATATAATASTWTLHITARVDIDFAATDVVLLEWETPGGSFVRWQLVWIKSVLNTRLIAYDAAGAATTVLNIGSVSTSFNIRDISAVQSGGNINIGYLYDNVSAYLHTATVAGTLAGISTIRVNPTRVVFTGEEFPVGHIALWPVAPIPYVSDFAEDAYGHFYLGARLSYQDEAAHLRLERLAGENNLAVAMPPVVDTAAVTRMGYQLPGAPVPLYQQCEDTDGGLIYEEGFGLGYLPKESRYNAPVVMTVDGDVGQLGGDFAPIPDDQLLRNRITVERVGGSSVVAEDEESIAASGAVDTRADVSLVDDTLLADQAGRRLRHLTATTREPRYGAISLQLHAGARALVADWCEVRPGSRIQVVNPPEQAPPGPVDQIVVGAAERIRRKVWRVSMQTEPAASWDVAVVDGVQRVPARGSTLAADLDAEDLALSLASTAANGVWSTDPADHPLDLRIGGYPGERVTASATTGATSPQNVTLSARAVNGVSRAWPAGTPVDVWDPAVVA